MACQQAKIPTHPPDTGTLDPPLVRWIRGEVMGDAGWEGIFSSHVTALWVGRGCGHVDTSDLALASAAYT